MDREAAVRDQPGRHRENSSLRVVSLPALGETTEAGHAVWAWTEDGGRVSGMREHPPGTGGPGCALSTSGAGVRVPADDDIHVTGPDGLHEPGVPGLGLDPRHAPGAMARTPLPLTGGCPFLQPESPTGATPGLTSMRAVQITRFGGPEVLDIVDGPEPEPGPGQKLYDASTAGVNCAHTHHRLS
jgi:hypothetical protein